MLGGGAARIGRAFMNLAYPPGCAACSDECGPDEVFCTFCADELALIEPPYCQVCGKPQPVTEASPLCSNCRQDIPAFDQVRALGLHTGPLAQALRGLKYHGRLSAGAGLARFWAQNIPLRWLRGIDLAAPVPLHPRRLIRRGFNQALLLSAKLPLPQMTPDLLIRTRHTRPQVGLGPAQRRQNVARAFKLREKYQDLVDGSRVLLLDDVYTSGATVNECACELKESGAAWVGVLTLVRAGRDPDPDQDHAEQEEA